MTPSMLAAPTVPADGRALGSRDSGAKGSGQDAGAPGAFEGVLAGVGASAISEAGAADPRAQTTASAMSPFYRLLSGKVVSDTSPDDSSSSESKSSKKDTDAPADTGTSELTDPSALAAVAAIAAAQLISASGQTTAASVSALSKPSMSAPAAHIEPASGPDTDGPDPTVAVPVGDISILKIETHLASGPAEPTFTPGKPGTPKEASIIGQSTGDATSSGSIAKSIEAVASPESGSKTLEDSASGISALPTPVQTLTKAVTSLASATPASAPLETSSTVPVAAPPRTMTVQLTPPDLGTVTVTLHLSGHALDLQLSVSDKDTLGSISRDRASLSQAVQDQGYDLRSLVIQGADGPSAQTGDANTSSRESSNQQMQSRADGQPSQSGSGARDQNDSRRGTPNQRTQPNETPGASVASGTGSLFV